MFVSEMLDLQFVLLSPCQFEKSQRQRKDVLANFQDVSALKNITFILQRNKVHLSGWKDHIHHTFLFPLSQSAI